MADTKYFRSFYEMLEKDSMIANQLYNKYKGIEGDWMYNSYILFSTKTAFVKFVFENELCFQDVQYKCDKEGTPNPFKYINYSRYADVLMKEWGWRTVLALSDGRVLLVDTY